MKVLAINGELHPNHGGDPQAYRRLVIEREPALRCAPQGRRVMRDFEDLY
jgi:hypothetical protein